MSLSTHCFGQHSESDSLKRQALHWYYQRNMCRETLVIVESEVRLLRSADSLCSLESESLRHAVGSLTVIVNDQAATIIEQSERIDRLRRQRRWLVVIAICEGIAVVALVL